MEKSTATTATDFSKVDVKWTESGRRRKPMQRWAIKVKARDVSKCRICGSKEELESHHIMPVSEYPHWKYEMDNGITLCTDCHYEADNGRISVDFLLNRALKL